MVRLISLSKRQIVIRTVDIAWLAVALLTSIFFLCVTTANNIHILMPLMAIFGIFALFIYMLQKREHGAIPFLELGVFYFFIVLTYSLYPIVTYLINGMQFPARSGLRLFQAKPTPQNLSVIAWYYATYLASFGAAYLLCRGRFNQRENTFQKPDKAFVIAIIAFYVLIKIFFIFIKLYYDLPQADSYTESYLVYQELPLLLRQVANHFRGIDLTLRLFILITLIQDYRKYRYIIFGWIAFEILMTLIYLGSRIHLVILLLSFVISYNYIVKPLKFRYFVIGAPCFLLLFLLLGLLRSDLHIFGSNLVFTLVSYNNEFVCLFENAYDLLQLKIAGATTDLSFRDVYFADVFRFIPQQLLPFEKIDFARWYVNTFYSAYAERGGGLAFGAIAESIIGSGWIDLIWRGGLLGIIFAKLHRHYVLSKKTFSLFAFYLWVTVMSYQSFRSTTFILVSKFFYQFLLPTVCIKLTATILKSSTKTHFTRGRGGSQ